MDLAFGIAPATLGSIADITGYPGAFLVSAVIAAGRSLLLVIRRDAARAGRTTVHDAVVV